MPIFTGTDVGEGVYGTWNPIDTDDVLYGLGGNDVLNGWGGNDTLYGGSGNDTLIAYNFSGSDILYGESGDDNYKIGVGDVVIETANNGIDTIDLWYEVGGIYTIPDNVENLAVRGSASIIGNSLNNTITVVGSANRSIDGGDGNDNLQGNGGADTLTGGSGNDVISGNNGDDSILGGSGNDTLYGGAGNDSLFGGAGNDSLSGGTGNDSFYFGGGILSGSVLLGTLLGKDTITDFTKLQDKIVLSKSTFSVITGALGSIGSNFETVANDSAALAGTSLAAILYSSSTGNLFYNQNGVAAGLGTNGGNFAILASRPTLVATDFSLVA